MRHELTFPFDGPGGPGLAVLGLVLDRCVLRWRGWGFFPALRFPKECPVVFVVFADGWGGGGGGVIMASGIRCKVKLFVRGDLYIGQMRGLIDFSTN